MIKRVFLFPGQGSQYIGMGKKLYDKYDTVKKTFQEADSVLGFALSELCFSGDINELTKTQNAQPAILTVSVAMFRVLQEKGIHPVLLAGHSLGEISALTCAGAIKFSDALLLARTRGELMQKAVPVGEGAMAAVVTRDIEKLQHICDEVSAKTGVVTIANYNTRTQQVISGSAAAVNEVVSILKQESIKTKLLNVSASFHCPLMKPAAEQFHEVLKSYTFSDLKYPVIANVNALPYSGKEAIVDNLTAQIDSPVRWADSMTYLKKYMTNYCIEVGPGHVLKNMMKTNISDIKVLSFDEEEDFTYGYIEKSYFPFVSRAMGIAVATKNTNWDEDAYNAGVVQPYNTLADMQKTIEKENRKATEQEIRTAVGLLKQIFQTKGTPTEEQILRFDDLFADAGQETLLVQLKAEGSLSFQ